MFDKAVFVFFIGLGGRFGLFLYNRGSDDNWMEIIRYSYAINLEYWAETTGSE